MSRFPRFVATLFAVVALVTLVAVGSGFALRSAFAAAPRAVANGTPVLSVVTPNGERVLELAARGTGYVGTATVRNDGNGSLTVSRVAMRGDENDIRTPANVDVQLGEGAPGSIVTLAPGQTRNLNVTWTAGRTARVAAFYAQVMIESNDPSSPRTVLGVHAQVPGAFPFVTSHIVTWLILLPLFGAAFALYLQLSKKTSPDADSLSPRHVAIGFAAAQTLIAIWAYATFDADLSRLDGTDGLQMIERGVLLRGAGIESFFAVDGVNIAPLFVVALTTLIAVATLGTKDLELRPRLVPLLLVLSSAAIGVLASFDATVFVIFVAFAATASTLLLARSGVALHHVRAFALSSGVAVLLLFVSIWTLRAHSDPSFLVDGTTVAHSTLLTDLSRVAFAAKREMVLGVPLVKLVTSLLVLAFLLLLPFGPLLSTTAGALAAAPPAVAVAVGGGTLGIGAYGLLRVLATVLPEGARWSAPTLAGLGAFGLLYGCLAAHGEADARRRTTTLACALSSSALLGLGALTPEGVHGAILAVVAPSLAVAFVSASASVPRLKPFAALASAGVVGPALWAILLAGIGAFATSPIAAVVALFSFAAACAIAVHTAHTLASSPASSSASSPSSPSPARDEGKRGPKVRRASKSSRALVPATALFALLLLLSLWPVPLLSAQGTTARGLVERLDPPGPDQIADNSLHLERSIP